MHTNLEIEYKTMITQQQFESLILAYPDHTVIQQTNTYFKPLQSETKSSIRIREIDGIYYFTCKIPTSKGIIEKEKIVKGNSSKDLNDPEILSCLQSFGIEGPFLQEGILHTERHLIVDCYGELCLDKSHYGNCTDYEIEYEIKGDVQAGFDRFMAILKKHQIEYFPSARSKHARCIQERKK